MATKNTVTNQLVFNFDNEEIDIVEKKRKVRKKVETKPIKKLAIKTNHIKKFRISRKLRKR